MYNMQYITNCNIHSFPWMIIRRVVEEQDRRARALRRTAVYYALCMACMGALALGGVGDLALHTLLLEPGFFPLLFPFLLAHQPCPTLPTPAHTQSLPNFAITCTLSLFFFPCCAT